MTISEITQGSYYRGDPALGGVVAPVVQQDLSAWQKLADFTYLRDQEVYRQKLADFRENTRRLADALSIDYSKIHPKHAEKVLAEKKEFEDWLTANPDAIEGKDVAKFVEYNRRKSNLANTVGAATQRSVEFAAMSKSISEKAPDSRLYELWMQEAEQTLDPDDVFKPIEPFRAYRSVPIDFGKEISVTGARRDGDYIITEQYQGVNFDSLPAISASLNIDPMQAGSSEYVKFDAMADNLNKIVQDFSKKPGMLNIDDKGEVLGFSAAAYGDTQIGPMLQSIRSFNNDAYRFANLKGAQPQTINALDGIDEHEMRALVAYSKIKAGFAQKMDYTGASSDKTRAGAAAVSAQAAMKQAKTMEDAYRRGLKGNTATAIKKPSEVIGELLPGQSYSPSQVDASTLTTIVLQANKSNPLFAPLGTDDIMAITPTAGNKVTVVNKSGQSIVFDLYMLDQSYIDQNNMSKAELDASKGAGGSAETGDGGYRIAK